MGTPGYGRNCERLYAVGIRKENFALFLPLPKVKKDYPQNKIKEETSKKNCKKEKTA